MFVQPDPKKGPLIMKYSLLLIMCRNERQPMKIMLVAHHFLKFRFQPLKKNRRTILTAAKHPRNDEKIEKPF
jgi:hypothetical protein